MSADSVASEIRGVRLVVSYDRITAVDRLGMVDITSDGAESWVYACVGDFHGMQGEEDGQDERVMEFAARLAALVREHYGAVRPLATMADHQLAEDRADFFASTKDHGGANG